jgi:hypothetical protein
MRIAVRTSAGAWNILRIIAIPKILRYFSKIQRLSIQDITLDRQRVLLICRKDCHIDTASP